MLVDFTGFSGTLDARHCVPIQCIQRVFMTASDDTNKKLPVIERIKQILSATPAERWEQGGEPLDADKKYQRPQECWEEVFCTDTKTGVLVLRKSTPITSNFYGGGYVFAVASEPRFLVELRARGWAPKMLIDPNFRASPSANKNCQVLAEGRVAAELYREIAHMVATFREEQRRDFNDSVSRLLANINEQIQETSADDWQEAESAEPGFTGYRGEIDGLVVDVSSIVRDQTAGYYMSFSQHGLRWHCRDSVLCREIFTLVDESLKSAGLEQLGKVLEDML